MNLVATRWWSMLFMPSCVLMIGIALGVFLMLRAWRKGKRMGHAGAIIGGANDTAQAKMDALRGCGVLVAESPADLGSSMAKALGLAGVAA
jgi:succinyl-CoA synthetase alpha subunit